MRPLEFANAIADYYRMPWSSGVSKFFHDALVLCLSQGFLYKAIAAVLAFAAIAVVVHILRLYLTKARMLGISAKEEARVKEELREKQKSGRLRY